MYPGFYGTLKSIILPSLCFFKLRNKLNYHYCNASLKKSQKFIYWLKQLILRIFNQFFSLCAIKHLAFYNTMFQKFTIIFIFCTISILYNYYLFVFLIVTGIKRVFKYTIINHFLNLRWQINFIYFFINSCA